MATTAIYRASRMENHLDHMKGREHTTFKYKVVKNYSNVIERRKPFLNKCIRWKEIHYSHEKGVQTILYPIEGGKTTLTTYWVANHFNHSHRGNLKVQ